MSVIWIDGFNQYGTDENALVDVDEYLRYSFSLIAGDYGYELQFGFGSALYFTPPTTQTTMVVGCRIRLTGGDSDFLRLLAHSYNIHARIGVSSTNEIIIYDSTGAVKATGNINDLPTWEYVYLEVKLILGTSVEVRINGKVVASDATGDYQYSSEEIGRFHFTRTGPDIRLDNIYVTDSEFLGEIIVKTHYPEVDGTHGDFEPSTGVDHYAVVDEAPPSATDYLLGTAPDDKESFTTAPTLEGPVKAVMVMNRVAKDGGLGAKAKNLVRVGGVDYLGSKEKYLGSDQRYLTELWENNPNTSSPWSIAEAEAMEFGLQITGLSTTTTTV